MALRLSATVIAAALGAIALILAAGSALGAMAPVAPTPPARQALARSAAARLFAAFPAIAGALQVSADPSVGGALANAGSGAPSMSRGLVDYTAYYTVASDGTFDAYRDVAGDLPPGEAQSLPSFGGGAIDETLDLYQPEAGLVLEGARIAVAATSDTSRYAIRVDAWAIPQPPRPESEELTDKISSVVVSSVMPSSNPPNPNAGIPGDAPSGPTTLISTLTSASAISALVEWFNARPEAAPFRLVCPGIYPVPLYKLDFHTASGTAATVEEDGCGDLAVTLGGKPASALTEGHVADPGLQSTSSTGLEPLLQGLHALSGANTSSGGPCSAQDFTAHALSLTVFGSPPTLVIQLTNASKASCTTEGFATLAFQDANHHALPTQLTDIPGSRLVTVPPGQHMVLQVNWTQESEACTGATVAYVVVTLPGTSSTLTTPRSNRSRPHSTPARAREPKGRSKARASRSGMPRLCYRHDRDPAAATRSARTAIRVGVVAGVME